MMSVGLLGTWTYHLYDKTRYSHLRNNIYIKDSLAVAQGIQDSLQKFYSGAITDLGARLDSSRNSEGELKNQLSAKLGEIYRLRTEIAGILKKNDLKKEDLDQARRKAAELQLLVADLQSRNSSIEEEKQQIASVLEKVNGQVKELESANQQLDLQNKSLTEKMSLASAFVASEIKLTPVTVKNDREQETNLAKKTSKLIVSFTVQNNIADYDNAEVFVVITRPDGNLLTTDVWESSATMEARGEGRKRYTRKIRFEYRKGEAKQLLFSLNADEYDQGTYTLQLYQNGYLIGQVSRVLG